MATLIQSVAKYGPRVEPQRAMDPEHLALWMVRGNALSPHQITWMLGVLGEAIGELTSEGRPVKLPGIGIFGVSVDRHGRRNVTFLPDRGLRRRLNERPLRDLPIRNRANIGLDDGGYKALWDAEHPDDPVEL